MLKVSLDQMFTNWDANPGEEDDYIVYAEDIGLAGVAELPQQIEFNGTAYTAIDVKSYPVRYAAEFPRGLGHVQVIL
jgi:hypothetical protein